MKLHPAVKRILRPPVDKFCNWFFIASPTGATGEFWDRYHRYIEHRYPVRDFLQHSVPRVYGRIRHRVRDAIWKVRHRTTDRYHVLTAPTLKPGYHDQCERMLHMGFELLRSCVEDGYGSRVDENKNIKDKKLRRAAQGLQYLNEYIADDDIRTQAPAQWATMVETRDLYLWWTVERPQRTKAFEDPRIWGDTSPRKQRKKRKLWERSSSIFSRDEHDGNKSGWAVMTDDFYGAQDQKMFERLAALRASLWS